MNALKCDRCGKLYESYFLTTDLTNVGKDYRHYRIEVQRIPDNYSHYLDLCKDCEKELIKWVEGYERKDL